MNKKIIRLAITLLTVAILVTPVLAVPTQGQKVPITLQFNPEGNTGGVTKVTPSGIRHWTNRDKVYSLIFSIDGAEPIPGLDNAISSYKWWTDDEGMGNGIYHEFNVLTFEGGTFEGNSKLKFTDFDYGTRTFNVEAHGVFHGTGVFEGQTIVAGYEGPSGGTWSGYLLKP